jgi:hypothetical protein
VTKALLKQHSGWLRLHAAALNRADARSVKGRAEGFELAQWALQTDAAEALTQMSARFSKGAGPLGGLVRERESLVARSESENAELLAAVSKNDTQLLKGLYDLRDKRRKRLESLDAELEKKFAEYADLANPKPITVAATQALLRSDEALILFLDAPQLDDRMHVPEEMLAWVVTRTRIAWHRVPLDKRALADSVMALRCGSTTAVVGDEAKGDARTAEGQPATRLRQERPVCPALRSARSHALYGAARPRPGPHQGQAPAHRRLWRADQPALQRARH